MSWALVPAAGSGRRFGGATPKQYLKLQGRTLLEFALHALLTHPDVDGAVVALAENDATWPGWATLCGKPVVACQGGVERADSVLAALHALPCTVPADAIVLVHDAARPNLRGEDIARLLEAAHACPDGAILAAPVRDTIKREAAGRIARTEPRADLWRALTPQAFRRDLLLRALQAAQADGIVVTDEAMAVERMGLHPRLVEGREDNLKVTTPADLALAEFLLSH